MRKLLEVSWEAWVDSGVDVNKLRGSSRVGVYIGCCGSEVSLPTSLVPAVIDLKPSYTARSRSAPCSNVHVRFSIYSFVRLLICIKGS